ncbi:MAG TPA: hypothetical protein VF522_05045 [Ramlibacter sp.]|uniref:hypothetical protein n=1 Tax=Ramlibacter sp. TaxID=1917967 RepID=UPI002ED0075F
MTKSMWRSLWLLRVWFAAAAAALVLASCGGGGGGGAGDDIRFLQPSTPAFQGTWQLTVSVDTGPESPPVAVDASAVPTSLQVARFTTSAIAQLVARTNFQGKVVSQSGTTITVTDPDTNYVLVIDSIAASNYQDCGTCQVGTVVSFNVVVNFTESGTFDGATVPANTDVMTLRFRYTRVG